MKHEFSRQVFKKYLNTKFNENPYSESRVVPSGGACGWSDRHMIKLIVAFRNFVNAPENATRITSVRAEI